MKDDTHSLSRSVLGDIRQRGMRSFFSPHLAGGMEIPCKSYRCAQGAHSPVSGILVIDRKVGEI